MGRDWLYRVYDHDDCPVGGWHEFESDAFDNEGQWMDENYTIHKVQVSFHTETEEIVFEDNTLEDNK